MLIGIDASRAVKTQKTGTEYYSQEIIKALSKTDRKNRYILYAPVEPDREFADALGRNFQWKILPFPKLWSQIRLSWELVTGQPKPDVIFEPSHTIPVVHTKNMVVTIHDLGFRHFPELYTPFERHYHSFSAQFSVTHASHIIAVSKYTKKDILGHYPVNPEKITVIYHGYDQNKFRPASKTELETPLPFGIKKPYIFFVGRLEHKKNLAGMLQTYQLLKREPGLKHQLVLAGKPGWGYSQAIQHKIDGVVETGYLERDQYILLLKHADVFFFPSLFEGFGLPIVEAMACAVPVVASNVTSIPEVVGSAGMLVNPRKPFEMAAAISKLIHTPSLRQQLISKGLVRASLFSWTRAAEDTLRVLEMAGMKA